MVITLKKGADKEEIKEALNELCLQKKPVNGIDAYKYCGTVSFSTSQDKMQSQLRSEWE